MSGKEMAAALVQLGMQSLAPSPKAKAPLSGGKPLQDKKDCECPKRGGAKPMFEEVCGPAFQRQALVERLPKAVRILKSFGH
jgi:hypothetical protein